MAREQILEALKDKPDLIKAFQDLAGLADAADKIKAANKDLTEQREAWETERKSLKEAAAKASTAAPGASPAELNALLERVAHLEKETQDAKAAAAKATAEKLTTDLKNSVVTAASTLKAVNPAHVFMLMQAEGLAGAKEDGNLYFHRLNEKKEPVAVTADDAVSAYLSANPHLVASSGSQGSGEKTKIPGTAKGGLLADPESYLK